MIFNIIRKFKLSYFAILFSLCKFHFALATETPPPASAPAATVEESASGASFATFLKGLRFDIVRAFGPGKFEPSGRSAQFENVEFETSKIGHAFGLGIGYENLSIFNRFGFFGRVIYNQYRKIEDTSLKPTSIRLDTNATYSITDSIYTFVGINAQEFTKSEFDNYEIGLGFQGGLAYKINQHLSTGLSYFRTTNKDKSSDDFKFDFVSNTVELNLAANF